MQLEGNNELKQLIILVLVFISMYTLLNTASFKSQMLLVSQREKMYLNYSERNESSKVTNFHINPKSFIETISTCLKNEECQVIYQHIGKTGGTTVESRMFTAFPFRFFGNGHQESCCGADVMKTFHKRPKKFCSAAFISFQVQSSFVEDVIQTCSKLNLPSRDFVVLVSIRDPISRTLSNIHQVCNKRFNKRSEQVQQACIDCTNDDHIQVFHSIAKLTNHDYNEILKTTKLATKLTKNNVKVLTFDTIDINSIFSKLQMEFPFHSFRDDKKANTEKTMRCDFAMKSSLMKELAFSLEVYRNISSGIF